MPPNARRPAQGARFHELLDAIRDTALVFLNAQINELFSSSDEALLDFAEHSESNSVQTRFFEAMGFVRRFRSELEHRFREEVSLGFERFGRAPDADSDNPDDTVELTLVGREEMEESVAVENLIMRTHSDQQGALHDLSQRLAVLNRGRKPDPADIPCGPVHLVHAYRNAMTVLNVDIKAKLVLYALFDKFILRQLNPLYDEFNSTLKNAGILPNLKPIVTKSDIHHPPHTDPRRAADTGNRPADQTGPGDHGAGEEDSQPAPSLGEELFDSILQLMANRRGKAPPGRGSPGPAMNGAAAPPARGAAAGGQSRSVGTGGPGAAPAKDAHEQLISAIDQLRPTAVGRGHGVLSDIEALPRVALDPGFLETLKQSLKAEREQILARVDREQMTGIDADTIDLIGMLFEYMLNDPLLPNVAKALLSHLHTPYLKVSLEDRQLLVDSEHPARLLLDLLVEAGGEWVYENDIKRGIFPHMQTVVDRILQGGGNKGLFSELLDYFKAAMEEQRRRTDAIEQRSKESAKGKEKLHVAKQRAAREMRTRVAQVQLPASARRFLTQAWSDRLVFILLRHKDGEMSEEWRHSLQVADDLVWLFDIQVTDANRDRVQQVCLRVRKAIKSALDTLGGYHQHYLEELFRFLDDPDFIADWQSDSGPGPYSEPLLLPDSEILLGDAPATPPAKAEPPPPPAVAHQRTPAEQEPAGGGEESLDSSAREMLDRLQNLKFGTWFEFTGEGAAPRRVKLSWLSPLTSTCMFVDRSGVQAEVKSLTQVAKMLAGHQARIIPQPRHHFVERAMLAIRNTLQRSMEATD